MKIDVLLQMIENAPNISSINDVLRMEQYRNEFELAELLLILSKYKQLQPVYYNIIFQLVTDENILKYRNNKEQLKLISKACECNFNNEIVNLILSKEMLENLNLNEQLTFINNKLKNEVEVFSDILSRMKNLQELKIYLNHLKDNTDIKDVSLNDYVPKYISNDK